MLRLRDYLRTEALSSAQLTAYVEFLDCWSMGDDFDRVMGKGTHKRSFSMGAVYFRSVTPLMQSHLLQMAKRKQQFFEQTSLIKTLAGLATSQLIPKHPISIALFRHVLGLSTMDSDYKEGSNKTLQTDAGVAPVRIPNARCNQTRSTLQN